MKKRTKLIVDMDGEVQYAAPPSPTYLDRFRHQGPLAVDPNLFAEDIVRLQFLVAFISGNDYNIQWRLDTKF